MGVLTFLSEIVRSVAWPVTVVVLVVVLRRPLVELIPLLRRLKYKELELDFSQQVSELKAEAESISQEHPEEKGRISPISNRILSLVSFSTRASIMEAWLEVESAAIAVASSFWNQPPNDVMRNYPKLGEYLLQCKVINEKQLGIFNTLRKLRNKAVHAEDLELNEKDTSSYVQLALDLAEHIRNAQ
ncbi:hypothetical protein [Chromohalobacter israelensis]|uniref:hypothetical protein n=1 Tax=Chromohalobacter israelensis TaxID=141390 RepID=UPI00265B7282|nr:hypothetical protein [Chromohalobacter salexigens]MDO0946112.1 hypothetical protein [Chromohalobacter salexigens]